MGQDERAPEPTIAELEREELYTQAAFLRGRVARMPTALNRLRSSTTKTADRLALLAQLRGPGPSGPVR
jgi:hypothetical protein